MADQQKKSTEEKSKDTVEAQAATQRSSSTLTTDTAALGTATEDGGGTPEPARPLRGTPFGVSGDILNPAFAAPRDDGHEKNLREAAERRQKELDKKE